LFSGFFASVMDSHVCQTCGLQFASDKARDMHAVRMHGQSTRCGVHVGKHVSSLRVSVVRTMWFSTPWMRRNVERSYRGATLYQ